MLEKAVSAGVKKAGWGRKLYQDQATGAWGWLDLDLREKGDSRSPLTQMMVIPTKQAKKIKTNRNKSKF